MGTSQEPLQAGPGCLWSGGSTGCLPGMEAVAGVCAILWHLHTLLCAREAAWQGDTGDSQALGSSWVWPVGSAGRRRSQGGARTGLHLPTLRLLALSLFFLLQLFIKLYMHNSFFTYILNIFLKQSKCLITLRSRLIASQNVEKILHLTQI